ncbi:MAG: alpha-galactosidase, partial [Segetibacter sp.]|nr:alpha-galactosidase [Segetibacter sp.]
MKEKCYQQDRLCNVGLFSTMISKSGFFKTINRSCWAVILFLCLKTGDLFAQVTNKPAKAKSVFVNNAKEDVISFTFGKSSRINYDLKTGAADIFCNNNKVISAAYAAVKNRQTTYTSKEYTTRKYSKVAFADAVGKGVKQVIELKGEGLPTMRQTFYTYPSKNYFFAEVSLVGSDLSSNYMSPLISNNVNIFASGDNRTILVPFDNDTFISYNAKSMSSP